MPRQNCGDSAWCAVGLLLAAACAAGCASTGEDSNTAVFQTPQQVEGTRKEQQHKRWQEMALDIAKEERPEVEVAPAAGGDFGIVMTADGVRQAIDLSPLSEVLAAQSGRAGLTLREHVRKKLPEFDQKRLARMSFESIRGKLRPMLINGAQLLEIQTSDGNQEIYPANTVAAGLYWVPGVRWSPQAITAVGPGAMRSWNVEAAALSKAALENVASEVSPEVFETSDLGGVGRVGRLKSGVEPGVVLSPKFLEAVRKAWGTPDEIAVLAASATDIRFLEEDRRELLDKMWPQWEMAVRMNREPLALRPFLLGDGGATAMAYNPPVDLYQAPGGVAAGARGAATRPTGPQATRRPAQPASGNRDAEKKKQEESSSAASRRPATRPSGPPKPAGRPYIAR